MEIPDIRGLPITVMRVPGLYPNFRGITSKLTMDLRQPSPQDLGRIKQALSDVSPRSQKRFELVHMRLPRGHPQNITEYAPHQPGQLGLTHAILTVNGEVVGFSRQLYISAFELPVFRIPNGSDIVCLSSILIVDKYQRRGLGSLYARINEDYSRYLGAEWIVGTTYIKRGFANIRLRSGFEVVASHGTDQISIRKHL